MQKVEYTHKGWFLFCPIWIADWESETPVVAPRYKLEPLPFCFMVNQKPLKKPVVHYYE